MATTQLLHQFLENPESNCCLFLDLYHAFDTPPKEAVHVLLIKRGIPTGIFPLLQSIFQSGCTRLLGPAEPAFGTTCGIKQGCPLSCLLFISYFQLFLDYISSLQLPHIAFVDDVAIVLHSSQVHSITTKVSAFLSSMGLVLNCKKSELLPIRPMESLPDPPCPIVDHVMHLGHPLPKYLQEGAACSLILEELRRTFTLSLDVPLPSLQRVRLENIVALPALLHRTECLWLPPPFQKEVYNLLLSFCLGVVGLPPHMSPKTIHGPPPYGLGLHHFPQRYSTRVLDTIHKAHLYSPLQHRSVTGRPMQPLDAFTSCLHQNRRPPPTSCLDPFATMPGHVTLIPPDIKGVECTHPPPLLPPGCSYSDGSYFSSSARAGAAAISPGGKVLMARTPGVQGIYPSELLGAYLASVSSEPHSTIFLDNQGAVKVLSNQKTVVRNSFLVSLARESITKKHQTVKWVKGHANQRGNTLADCYARKATSLPSQCPARPQTPWDVIIEGLPQRPPHKCWTELNVPSHQHTDIHPISFTPLKRSPDSLPWIKWLFGLCWRPGWAAFQTFWSQTPSHHACPTCHEFHNASINGTLSFCDHHPLRQAWLQAWNHHPLVLHWVRNISRHDRVLLGKACIPRSLHCALTTHLGRAGARKLIFFLPECSHSITPEMFGYLLPPGALPRTPAQT